MNDYICLQHYQVWGFTEVRKEPQEQFLRRFPGCREGEQQHLGVFVLLWCQLGWAWWEVFGALV